MKALRPLKTSVNICPKTQYNTPEDLRYARVKILTWYSFVVRVNVILKDKAVPLQAWSGPEGSRKLKFPDFMTTAQGSGKVVSLTHRPHLPPGSWYSFLLQAESTPGP
jgi:hypothetical protein